MAILSMEGFDNGIIPPGFDISGQAIWSPGRDGTGLSLTTYEQYLFRYWSAVRESFEPQEKLFFMVGFLMSALPTGPVRVVTFYERTNTPFYILYTPPVGGGATGGKLGLYAYDVLVGETPTNTIFPAVWMHLGVDLSVSQGNSFARFYLNGEFIAASGGFSIPTDVVGISQILVSVLGTMGENRDLGDTAGSVDDWIRLDETGSVNKYLGDSRIAQLIPNGNGDVNQWDGSDGDKIDNWMLVDDAAGGSDYVSAVASNTGARDMYTLSDKTLSATERIVGVQIEVLAAKQESGASAELLGILKDSSGSEVVTPIAQAVDLSHTNRIYKSQAITTSPRGDAWSNDDAMTLTAGVQIGEQSEGV